MKRSYVVIGMGRFGTAVAEKLYALGNEVMILDHDAAQISHLADSVTHAVVGDARDESVLRGLGVQQYDCVIVSVGTDLAASVLITLNLKELGVKQIICKAMDESHRKVLSRIGADNIVIPEQQMAEQLAKGLSCANVLEYIDLSDDYGIAEIPVPKKWIGHSVVDLLIRSTYGVDVLGIKQDDKIRISPGPHYVFQERDVVMVLGDNNHLEKLETI
ncbi:MAG: TrkA family potassium uptake protein [Ruminococcaceae bacterium]|nr:TrkA family potassium uptake protein [Oscillospiraceae bacterium]